MPENGGHFVPNLDASFHFPRKCHMQICICIRGGGGVKRKVKKAKKNGMKIVLGVPRQADKMIDAGPGDIYGKGKKKN